MTRTAASFVLALLLLAPLAARAEGDVEIWRFEKGEVVRTVDVTAMPDVVREAVLERMRRDGFARAEPAAPVPGRDLARDAAILARHGGHFPEVPQALEAPAARRGLLRAARRMIGALLASPATPAVGQLARDFLAALEALDEGHVEVARAALAPSGPASDGAPVLRTALRADLAPLLEPAARGLLLGAEVVVRPIGEGWRVRRVPPGTPAAALGLEAGDRVLAVDGRAADPAALSTWVEPAEGGAAFAQRTLRLRRRDGQIEIWTISPVPWPPLPVAGAPTR